MKKTRYILIALALIIAAVTVAVLTSVTQIATMEADGYAVSGTANLKSALTKGEDVTQTMEAVHQDDTIYASALGYYVGTNRTPIDRNYPVYLNDGQTLRFLDDDKWLVATDLKLLQTYNGLYLNDGFTYNRDLSQADGEEFLLLALNNGLYINAQKAVFTNSTSERDIPLNSICYFTDSFLRWYRYENGKLFYEQEDSVGAATISIGGHEFTYEAFLEALDLIEEEIEHTETGETPEETTAPQTVEPAEPETDPKTLPPETSAEATGDGGSPLPTEAKLEEEEIFYLGEVNSDDDRVRRTGISESGNGEGKTKDIPSGNRNAVPQEADDIADSDREEVEPGGDIPDTDKHASSGRTTPGGSSSGGGTQPVWKMPVMSLSNYKTWMYALDATLNYSDPSNALSSSVIISVYSKITLESTEPIEPGTDAEGHKVYPYADDLTAYSASELDLVGRTSLIGTQEFAISPLQPGATVYVQYSYEYKRTSASSPTRVLSDFTEIKLDDFDEDKLVPVLSTYSVEEAEFARKFAFHKLVLANEPQPQAAAAAVAATEEEQQEGFDFEKFKKDSLPYISHMTVELYNETTQEAVHMPMNDTYVKVAKKKEAEYISRAELEPGCVYTYKVYGTDDYGNVFPLKIQTEDMPVSESYLTFEGTLYTRKEAPDVSVRFEDITKNTAKTEIEILDEHDVLLAEYGLQVSLKDKDGKTLKISGSLKKVIDEKKGQYGPVTTFTDVTEVTIPLTDGEIRNAKYKLELNGLSTFTNYVMKIEGTYDPNLTVAGHQTQLDKVKEILVSQSFWTARDSQDYNTPTSIFESVEAVSSTSVKGSLWLIDDMSVMPSGAVITVYDGVRAVEKSSVEEPRGTAAVTGKTGTERSFDKKEYTGIHILNRTSVAADGEVILKDLVPGSKAYVQLSYNVIYLDNGHQKNATVQSNLLEVTLPDETYSLNTVTVHWDEGFATGEQSISLENIRFTESSTVKAPVSAKDKLLDYIEMTLTPAAATGDPVKIRISSDVIDRAKRSSGSFDSGNIKELKSDTMYVYSIRGYRWDGTELPLMIDANGRGAVEAGQNAGYLYTCKQTPKIRVGKSQNSFGNIHLELYYDDPNEALLLDHDVIFRLYEVKKIDSKTSIEVPVTFSGKLDGVAFSEENEIVLGPNPDHTVDLTGLTIGTAYRITVTGSYCLQPTAKAADMTNRLPQLLDQELVPAEQREFVSQRGTQPVVSMSGIEPWVYAVGAKLEVDDPSATITAAGIRVLVTDENGGKLFEQAFAGTQAFAVYPLEPGSRAFISYSYDYVDPVTTDVVSVKSEPVFVELLSFGEAELEELRGSWNEAFASSDSAVTFNNIKFYNSSDYEAEPEEFTFENFKKDVLKYLDHVDVEFTPVGAGERVKVSMSKGVVSWAKMEETEESDISLTTRTGLMLSNKKYTYKINAKDPYGNTVPLKVSVNGEKFREQTQFTGEVYTAKKAPTVRIMEMENLIGSMKLHVEVTDTDNSIVDGTALEFCIRDKDGVIQLSGDIAGQIIDETNFGPTSFKLSGSNSYDIVVNNLELGFHYTAQVRGSYDPQPDEKPREEGYDLDIFKNSLLGKKNFIANDGDLTLPGKTGEAGTDPEQLEKGTFVGYIEPKVTMGDLEGWVYAVGTDLTVYDPTATIESGVTVSVFSGIKGSGKSTPNAKGQRVYEGVADNGAVINEGTETVLRKNVRDSGEIALGTIRPGSTVYVQYSYSYYETKIKIIVDAVTRRKTLDTNERIKKSYHSSITQVKLLTIKEGNMAAVSGSWNTDFALYPDTYSLNSVSFKNSSDYDPNPSKFTFANYKKNTVGYLNDVQMTLTKLDASGKETGSTITVPLTSSLVSSAISVSSGVVFNASNGLLEPDTVYSYTVKGVDVFGLEIPVTMKVDGAATGTSTTTFKGNLYTRKDIPEVTQTVTDNSSGVVTLKINTNDKWSSLERDSMVLTIYDALTMKTAAILGGTINGEAIPDGTTALPLTGSDTNEYIIVLNTLDFYAGYGARVTGTYDPQPTHAPEGKKVDKEKNVKFSEMYFQTAEMASGTVYFGISTEKVTSNSGTVRAVMTSSARYPTAKAPVGIINRIHIKVAVRDTVVTEFDVLRSELEAMKFEGKSSKDYEIPGISTDDIKVYVSGAPRVIETGVTDENLWQAIMGRWTSKDEFVSPLPLKIVLGKGTLASMTEYTVSLTPYCDRPNSLGREVRNGLSTGNKFTTLKKDPVLVKDELLVAGPSVQLKGAYVLDEDNAINGTFANVTLTDTTTGNIVAADTLPVHKTKPATPLSAEDYKDLAYSDLNSGDSYLLEVYTTAFDNTVAGSTPVRFQIAGVTFTAGAKFSGNLNLESLQYDTSAAGRKTLLSLNPAECKEKIDGGVFTNKYDTGLISLAEDQDGNPITINTSQTIAVTAEMPLPVRAGAWFRIRWYNSSKSHINYQEDYRGGSTWIAPPTAVYYRIEVQSNCSFEETGLELVYTTAKKLAYTDSTDEKWKSERTTHYHSRINGTTGSPYDVTTDFSSLYMLETEPGASYVFRTYSTGNYGDINTAAMFFYNADRKLVSKRTMNAQPNYIVTVPEGISYISYEWSGYSDANHYALYRVGDDMPVSESSYTAELKVELKDLENYLYALKDKGAGAWLKVEKMDSIRQTERGEQYQPVDEIPIEFAEGGYQYEGEKILSGLAADTQWRVTLYAKCKIGGTAESPVFTEVTLDTVMFQTDAEYELIHNMNEVKKIRRNPYGNYLVVNDFVQNLRAGESTLYGVLDFQGHVVTENGSNVSYFLDYVGTGGILRNMVVEYEECLTDRDVRPVVYGNYGTVDNLVIRTKGEFHHLPYEYYSSFLVMYNYGVIRNFIFEMNGNFVVERVLNSTRSYPNLLIYQNFGTLENWYVYAANNAKLIIGNLPKESESYVEGSLYYTFIRGQYGLVRNGFTKFDMKIYTPPYVGTTSFHIIRNEGYSDNISNYYHVGDYTLVDTSGNETTSHYERILYSNTNGKLRNIWHLTDLEYNDGTTAATSYAKKANVRNANWQSGVLADGFDIAANIKLGYYPRLYMNDCMKKYQPYIPLDTVIDDSSVPTFMNSELLKYTDNPADPTEQFSAGQIRLYFKNQSYETITDVTITGLTVTGIQRQGMNSQNLYEVDVNVYIDPTEAAKGAQGYLSKYTLDSILTKSKGSTPISIRKIIPGVAFYKTVQGVDDWVAINRHMNWNYRLMNDLTFGKATVTGTGARIFGTNINSQKDFTGTIDGNGYTLYGLEIEDGQNANIIHRLVGGTVENLTVDGLKLSLNRYPTTSNVGFIGYASAAVMDNIHVMNSELEGFGMEGAVVGYMHAYSRLSNCSGINNYIGDVKSDTESFMGGLAGYGYYSLIASCYVRDTQINPKLCTNIHGVGGIAGRLQGTTIQDCYSTGSITGTGYNAGGIVGNYINSEYCHYESLWSRMTIDMDGDFVGGFAGRSNGSGEGILAMGDIYVDGIHVHRGNGYANNSSVKSRMVAYSGQKVPGITSLNRDDCYALASVEDLLDWKYWADHILLDENWNLKSCWVDETDDQGNVTGGHYEALTYFPMVYEYSEEELDPAAERNLVKYQEESPIYLPGQGGEYVLTVGSMDYVGTPGQMSIQGEPDPISYKELYAVEFTLDHPGLTHEAFREYYEYMAAGGDDGTGRATDVINIDGMDMLDKSQTIVLLNEIIGKPNTTKVVIYNYTNNLDNPVYLKALDKYRLTVHYEQKKTAPYVDETLIADIVYTYEDGTQKINYWKISNLADWQDIMTLGGDEDNPGHGKSKENFLITGTVNFNNGYGVRSAADEAKDTFRNLIINRLEGAEGSSIENLYYTTNTEADPWIASVVCEMKGLTFRDCTGDLSRIITQTSEPAVINKEKTRNGVIFSVRDIKECTFDGLRTIVGTKTCNNSAFIMIGYGSVEDCTIRNLYYDTADLAVTDYNYAAGFLCWLQGSAKNNLIEQIHVVAPNARYVGGVFCYINGSKWASQFIGTEAEVSGNRLYGGTVRANTGDPNTAADDIPAGDSIVKGARFVGGIASHIYEGVVKNTVGRVSDDLYIEAKDRVGGISYYVTPFIMNAGHPDGVSGNTAVHIHVTSTEKVGYTGGLFAYTDYLRNMPFNRNLADGVVVTAAGGYAGGLFGYVNSTGYSSYFKENTVINSTVTTGALTGKETSESGVATGGFFGYTNSYLNIYGCVIRNSTVSGPRNVGGIVGNHSTYYGYVINSCYVAEDVSVIGTNTENSNAGGIVGYAKTLRMAYCSSGASVTAAGKNAGGLVGKLNQHKDDYPAVSQCYFVGNVTAADYAAGIIGYNMNNVEYTVKVDSKTTETRYQTARFLYNGNKTTGSYRDRGYMYGIFVAGTITTTGAAGSDGKPSGSGVHASYAFNNEKDTDLEEIGGDNPKLFVWDQTVINGVRVNVSKKPFESALVTNPASIWMSASMFRERSYYENPTAANFGSTYFSYSTDLGVCTEYMPFVKYSVKAGEEAVLPYEAYKSYDEYGAGVERGGIKLPDYGTNPDAVQVYASGVSTVNIEVSEHQYVRPEDDWDEDYTQVEYIQSVGGKSYIRTDYDGNDVDLLVDCKFTDVPTTNNYLFGQMQAHGNMLFNGLYRNDRIEYNWKTITFKASTTLEMKQSFTADGKFNMNINGVNKTAAKPETNDSQKNMLIFAWYNSSGNVAYFGNSIKCYYFKLHLGNNEPFMDLYPCIRKSDGKAGMFDKVGKKFYPSMGSADFVAGPEVTKTQGTGGELNNTGAGVTNVYVKFTPESGTPTTMTYTTDSHGVVTVDYDFTSMISVSTDGVHYADYTADELRRSVSLTGRYSGSGETENDIWYYLNTNAEGDRQLSFGTVADTVPEPEYTLPEDYTAVKYVRAEGSQYIKTGVRGVAKAEYKIAYTPYKTNRQLMGWSGSYATYWGIRDATGELGGKFENGGSVSTARASLGQPDTVLWDFRLGGTSRLYVNGVNVANVDPSNVSMYDWELQLLALNGGYLNYADLYECKIWQNEKMVRWFVPAVYKKGTKDEAAGMYDLIGENFYKSASKKAFIAGPAATIPTVNREKVAAGTVNTAGVGDPIHVWGDQVLIRDGSNYYIYTLSPSVDKTAVTATVSLVAAGSITNGTAHAAASPFLEETITVNNVPVAAHVYKNFTVLDTSPEETVSPLRMYVEGTMSHNVSPWEDQVYDKVIMRDAGNKKYIAVLSGDGGLTANFVWDALRTGNIREISNSFTSNDPYIVVLYNSGALRVVNYETGSLLFNTEENAGFLSYVTSVLNSMTGSVSRSGSSGGSGSGGSGSEAPKTQISYTVMGGEGLSVTGTTAKATGLAALTFGSGTQAGTNTVSGTEQAVQTGQGADAGGAGNTAGTANNMVSGQAGENGQAAGNGTVSTDSSNAVAGQSGTVEAEKSDKEKTGTTDGKGQEVPERTTLTASALFIPGEGVLDTEGNVIVPAEETEYVPGEGVYVGGKLAYEESIFADDEELTAAITAQALAAADAKQEETAQEETADKAQAEEESGEEADEAEAVDEEDGEEADAEEEADGTEKAGDAAGTETDETDGIEGIDEEDGEDEEKDIAGISGKKTNGTSTAAGTHVSGANGVAGEKTGGSGGTAGSGTAAGGKNTPAGADMSDAGGNGESRKKGTVLLVTGAEKRRQIADAIGENVTIMNTVTGREESVDTEILFDGDVVSTAEKQAAEEAKAVLLKRVENEKAGREIAEAIQPEEAVAAAGGAFAVTAGLGRSLGEEETSGFMLIGLTVLLAVLIFAVIYFTVVRRKRKLLNNRISRKRNETMNSGNSGEEER